MSLIIETLFATTLPDLIEVLLQALSFERHAGAGTTHISGAWSEKRSITVVTSAGESHYLNDLAGGKGARVSFRTRGMDGGNTCGCQESPG
jgi:hypothetical protein